MVDQHHFASSGRHDLQEGLGLGQMTFVGFVL